jgi:hypothetical protein
MPAYKTDCAEGGPLNCLFLGYRPDTIPSKKKLAFSVFIWSLLEALALAELQKAGSYH